MGEPTRFQTTNMMSIYQSALENFQLLRCTGISLPNVVDNDVDAGRSIRKRSRTREQLVQECLQPGNVLLPSQITTHRQTNYILDRKLARSVNFSNRAAIGNIYRRIEQCCQPVEAT